MKYDTKALLLLLTLSMGEGRIRNPRKEAETPQLPTEQQGAGHFVHPNDQDALQEINAHFPFPLFNLVPFDMQNDLNDDSFHSINGFQNGAQDVSLFTWLVQPWAGEEEIEEDDTAQAQAQGPTPIPTHGESERPGLTLPQLLRIMIGEEESIPGLGNEEDIVDDLPDGMNDSLDLAPVRMRLYRGDEDDGSRHEYAAEDDEMSENEAAEEFLQPLPLTTTNASVPSF